MSYSTLKIKERFPSHTQRILPSNNGKERMHNHFYLSQHLLHNTIENPRAAANVEIPSSTSSAPPVTCSAAVLDNERGGTSSKIAFKPEE